MTEKRSDLPDKYELYNIDPGYILEMYSTACKAKSLEAVREDDGNYRIGYTIDFRNDGEMAFRKHLLISSTVLYPKNALLYQLEKMLSGREISWDRTSLKKHIMYLDFSQIFYENRYAIQSAGSVKSLSKEEIESGEAGIDTRLSHLFTYGFSIIYPGEDDTGETMDYVPFDKSSSMSREGRITFINKAIKEELDRRLLMDIPFEKITLIPSKFYAYRGLYMSDGIRVEPTEELVFNEETVIVIRDDSTDIVPGSNEEEFHLFGEIARTSDSSGKPKWELGNIPDEKIRVTLTPFDGEGLVSPGYARLINPRLGERGFRGAVYEISEDFSTEASSFQIRMPFTKGVLHTVDFISFYDEFLGRDSALTVTDCFGIERDLRKAEIILTQSMFKSAKWLRKIWELRENDTILPEDPMKYYFERFAHYDHALYVGNTDLVLSGDDTTRMNYQFLNTLDMSGQAFENLVDFHLSRIDEFTDRLISGSDEEEAGDGEKLIGSEKPSYLKAVRRNDAFIRDPKIKAMVAGTRKGLIEDIAKGRLRVAGECRFLSNDLLSFLTVYLPRYLKIDGETKEKHLSRDELASIYTDRFYMPRPRIRLRPGMQCGFFRSPHLSRNEQCVLRSFAPARDSVYDRFFSHLTGVVMVARTSLVPMILSGADFDGDLVKVVSDRDVTRAVIDGVYDPDEKRRLPVIQIPDTKELAPETDYFPTVDYTTIKNTFSNSIGEISNLAIQIGKKEYFEADPAMQGKSAECTVVTGLEIDAAKTGMHPAGNISELRKLASPSEELRLKKDEEEDNMLREEMGYGDRKIRKRNEKDYYLNALGVINALPKYGVQFSESRRTKEISVKVSRETRARLKIKPLGKEENSPNIDRLPWYYAVNAGSAAVSGETRPMPERRCWDFEDDKTVFSESTKAQLRELVEAYLRVYGINAEIYRLKKTFRTTKYAGSVYTLLKLQYDDVYTSRLNCGETVQYALDRAYSLMYQVLDTPQKKEEALKRLVSSDWAFTEPEKRGKVLSEILGCGQDDTDCCIVELMSNFTCGGCRILYYALKHLVSSDLEYMSVEEWEEYESGRSDEDAHFLKDNRYFGELYDTYKNAVSSENCEKKIWEEALVSLCRDSLEDIFGKESGEGSSVSGDDDIFDLALKYVWDLRSTDKNRTFLWNVIPEKTLLKHVYIGGKGGQDHAE